MARAGTYAISPGSYCDNQNLSLPAKNMQIRVVVLVLTWLHGWFTHEPTFWNPAASHSCTTCASKTKQNTRKPFVSRQTPLDSAVLYGRGGRGGVRYSIMLPRSKPRGPNPGEHGTR